MDKFEYKIRAEEIKTLIAEGEYAEAVEIADTIDWRKVRSVMMLCTISDLYKINRRFQESKDILLLAYEKHPTGRLIVYSLCELSIKMEEYVQAIEYYKEFVQIAPKDTGRYILQYRLYEAQDVSLEERIAVLEEFKKRDYREKWAYELAYLYHRIGLSTKCVEECDEMFLWFGEGKYVVKALELKKLHEPLNADQQDKYALWMQARETEEDPYEEAAEEEYTGDAEEDAGADGYARTDAAARDNAVDGEVLTTELPEVKTVDLGQYNTINLQRALAESMKEILSDEDFSQEPSSEEAPESFYEPEEAVYGNEGYVEEEAAYGDEGYVEEEAAYGDEGYVAEEAAYGNERYVAEETAYENERYAEEETVSYVNQEQTAQDGMTEIDSALYQPEELETPEAADEIAEDSGTGMYEKPETTASENNVEEESVPEAESQNADVEVNKQSWDASMLGETIRLPDTREVERRLRETTVTKFPQKTPVRSAPVEEATAGKVPETQTPAVQQPVRETVGRQTPTGETADKETAMKQTSVVDMPVKQVSAVEAPTEQTRKSNKTVMDTDSLQEISAQIVREDTATFDARKILEQMKAEAFRNAEASLANQAAGARTGVMTPLNAKPSKFDHILSQEYDGQISLVVPEAERVEKQITGQISIEDVMAEWEEMKKTNEQKRMEDVKQRILRHTGDLFANFDEATKNGLLEELERAFIAAIMKDSDKKLKKVILPDDDVDEAKEQKNAAQQEEKEIEEVPAQIAEEEAKEPDAVEGKVSEETDKEQIPEEAVGKSESDPKEESQEHGEARERNLTEEERELFGEFIHHRRTERQVVKTLDNMSLAPYTGNVRITGEEEETTLELAKALVKEMQLNDSNFSGKVAKISASVLNKKDVEEVFGKLDNGALIIENASRLKSETMGRMLKVLDKDNMGLLVLLTDRKQEMNQLLAENPGMVDHFNLCVDVEALDDEALVSYARQYAEELEYSIDEFGILALHTRIADMQTSDHEVNLADVRELVDEAIYYADKKTPGHFMDILLSKRYDEDDMIILREKDFMHY